MADVSLAQSSKRIVHTAEALSLPGSGVAMGSGLSWAGRKDEHKDMPLCRFLCVLAELAAPIQFRNNPRGCLLIPKRTSGRYHDRNQPGPGSFLITMSKTQ